MNENGNDRNLLFSKISVMFVGFSGFLVSHQIDVTSRHYAVSFNIPIHNTSIYFNKLYSLRCISILFGHTIENIFYQIGGGDSDGRNEGEPTRKYVAIVSIAVLLIIRIALLATLYVSSQLSYHVYIILTVEAFFYGLFEAAITGLASGYIPFVAVFYNLCRVFVVILQFVLDIIWFKIPLFMIKIQTWVCVIFTAISVGLWVHFNTILKSQITKTDDTNVAMHNKHDSKTVDSIDSVISPFIMFIGASTFKDFLYPGTLPYALLQRDKCHTINMCMPILYLVGPLILLLLDQAGAIEKWEWYHNLSLILIIPMSIIFVYCFLAIHTQIQSARKIINSRPRVMTMSLVLSFCYSLLETLNFIGIAKYAFRGNPYGYTIQFIHNIVTYICRSFISKLSVGYTVTRVSLGYHLPKFRPNHKMSKRNVAWYFIRNTFSRAGNDTINDFKVNIKDYL